MRTVTIHGIATALILGVLVASATACDTETAAQEVRPKQEKPAKKPRVKPAAKPAKISQNGDGVPKLTGDHEKDSAAVKAALVKLKTEYDHNAKLVAELTRIQAEKKGRIGKAETERLQRRVAALKSKNDTYKTRAERLQDLLGKLRN